MKRQPRTDLPEPVVPVIKYPPGAGEEVYIDRLAAFLIEKFAAAILNIAGARQL
jgi:hypothetical protein